MLSFKMGTNRLGSIAKTLLSNNQTSFARLISNKSQLRPVVFRQLFDNTSYTYTYILGDAKTREAVIIDPVIEMVERDLELIKELDLNLKYALNTHVHADHVTGSGKIKSKQKSVKSVISAISKAKADIHLNEGDEVKFGNSSLLALSTPGHTNGCMSFVSHALKAVFTGDSLFIRGCGRTDFQQGSSSLLYDSVHKKLYALPDDYVVYPGHDYTGQLYITIDEEKKFNPRLTKTKSEFAEIMKNLNLANPKLIELAVPANMVCGMHYVFEENKNN